MARFNLAVILGLFVACFLVSADILYAQIVLGSGYFSGFKSNNIDPCTGTTSKPTTIGQTCVGGALYAGTGYASPLNPSLRYMVTPSGCTNSPTPTCAGTTQDSVQEVWETGIYTSNNTGATNLTNGQNNTGVLANLSQTGGNTTPAAAFCSNMHYGGYHDWFLPSKNELNYVLYNNMSFSTTPPAGKIGGFESAGYWSSTEVGVGSAYPQNFSNDVQFPSAKPNNLYVRCVRVY